MPNDISFLLVQIKREVSVSFCACVHIYRLTSTRFDQNNSLHSQPVLFLEVFTWPTGKDTLTTIGSEGRISASVHWRLLSRRSLNKMSFTFETVKASRFKELFQIPTTLLPFTQTLERMWIVTGPVGIGQRKRQGRLPTSNRHRDIFSSVRQLDVDGSRC